MEQFISSFPQQWQEIIALLLGPVGWIPRLQYVLMDFFLHSPSPWVAAAKYVLLLFPALLGLAALWCTQLSIYTLPFRNGRVHFVSALLLTWWDAARAVWLYWTGLVRFIGVALGWIVIVASFLVRLVVEATRKVTLAPFTVTGRMAQRYFQPGVPWVAFVALMLWCLLEATVFTHVLFPTVTDVLSRLAETPEPARVTGPVLFVFLMEIFVAFFEVMFLYREIVAAFMPSLADQQAGTLVVATCGWLGVRGMTWFLFGQYGAAPMMAFMSRRPLISPEAVQLAATAAATAPWWEGPLRHLRRETEWLHTASERLLDYLALPVLHVAAAAVNFAMVLVVSRPVFNLPFKALDEIPESRTLLSGLHLQPRKS